MFALTQGLHRAVQTQPHRIATDIAGRQSTWQQRIAPDAGALSALGVRRGDRLANLTPNSDRHFKSIYARRPISIPAQCAISPTAAFPLMKGVGEVVAIGAPDDRRREQVHAIVTPGRAPDPPPKL